MGRRRRALAAAALGGIPILASLALVSQAGAHGSMQSPVSRTSACFLAGPESPDTDACRAVATGGTQPPYDWNEVNIATPAGPGSAARRTPRSPAGNRPTCRPSGWPPERRVSRDRRTSGTPWVSTEP